MNYEELFDLELRIVVRYLKTIKNKKEYNYVLQSYININKLCYEELIVAKDKEIIYKKYCDELKKLVKRDYEVFELLEYLDTINSENINQSIDYCLECLEIDFNIYTKEVLNKMLFVIYLEYFYLNTTSILDKIKTNDFYTDSMSLIIKENLDECERCEKLKGIIDNFGYLDIEVIKYLMANNNYFKSLVSKHSKELLDDLDKKEDFEIKRKIVKVEKKKINKKVLALTGVFILTSLSIALGTIVRKRSLDKTIYETDLTIYSDYSLSQDTINMDYFDGNRTYVVSLEPWQKSTNGFTRNYSISDVSYIDYDDLSKYLVLDLERLGIIPKNLIQEKELLMPEDLYEDTQTKVIRLTQANDALEYHVTKDEQYTENIVFSIYIAIVIIIAIFLTSQKIYSIKEIKEKIIYNNLNYNDLKSDVENFLDAYSTRDYKKIEQEFMAFCSKYEYLITDRLVIDKYNAMKLEREK